MQGEWWSSPASPVKQDLNVRACVCARDSWKYWREVVRFEGVWKTKVLRCDGIFLAGVGRRSRAVDWAASEGSREDGRTGRRTGGLAGAGGEYGVGLLGRDGYGRAGGWAAMGT